MDEEDHHYSCTPTDNTDVFLCKHSIEWPLFYINAPDFSGPPPFFVFIRQVPSKGMKEIFKFLRVLLIELQVREPKPLAKLGGKAFLLWDMFVQLQ